MNERLEGRIALVTGASRGLGRAIALRLHREGAFVIGLARPSDDLQSLGEEIEGHGEVWPCDVTSDNALERIQALSQLDVLVNNAGTNQPELMVDVTDETLDHVLELNVRTAFRVARSSLRVMKEGASVINMTSQMGHVGSPRRTVYCMTKHALEGLTKAMAVELAPRGIRVNAVAPTFVETPMTKPMLDNPQFREFVNTMIPLGRVATVDDVAGAVAYLASHEAGMITGHSLLIDGGWTAQ
ncbi:MAG: SDR family oxidoreductase [Pseudomonadota bacterium]